MTSIILNSFMSSWPDPSLSSERKALITLECLSFIFNWIMPIQYATSSGSASAGIAGVSFFVSFDVAGPSRISNGLPWMCSPSIFTNTRYWPAREPHHLHAYFPFPYAQHSQEGSSGM